MMKMKEEWSKAFLVRPHDNISLHKISKADKFIPSYEKDPCPVSMNWLLGWEYSRIWLSERDQYIAKRQRNAMPKHIKNDYSKWLSKRTKKFTKVC